MILIVIDMQKGFVKTAQQHETAKKIAEALESGVFSEVIFTKFFNSEGSLFYRALDFKECCDPESQEITPELAPYARHVFNKTGYSCVNPSFRGFLRELNRPHILPEKVAVCGCELDACVLATCMDLFSQGILPIVLADLCFCSDGWDHAAAVRGMMYNIGLNNVISPWRNILKRM